MQAIPCANTQYKPAEDLAKARAGGAQERILERTVRTAGGCLEWQGALCKGYGHIGVGGRKVMTVHRLMAKGLPTAEKPHALHSCDNSRCCNPEHINWGSHAKNQAEKAQRGRAALLRGESNGNSKLTAEQVRVIRAEYVPHSPVSGTRALARKYGVSNQLIGKIVNGKMWPGC